MNRGNGDNYYLSEVRQRPTCVSFSLFRCVVVKTSENQACDFSVFLITGFFTNLPLPQTVATKERKK